MIPPPHPMHMPLRIPPKPPPIRTNIRRRTPIARLHSRIRIHAEAAGAADEAHTGAAGAVVCAASAGAVGRRERRVDGHGHGVRRYRDVAGDGRVAEWYIGGLDRRHRRVVDHGARHAGDRAGRVLGLRRVVDGVQGGAAREKVQVSFLDLPTTSRTSRKGRKENGEANLYDALTWATDDRTLVCVTRG